jgi:molecular chaperone DnaK (HSP70)
MQEIFGIDLGTTNSCIAHVDQAGQAIIIPNCEGEMTTPSVVQFEHNTRIIGREAKRYALLYPEEVAMRFKQKLGQPGERYSYKGHHYTPEEVSSYVLKKLANDAEVYLHRPVKDVVITCPAYFGVAQREATAKAGEIAGLIVHEVLNEPTAAAILYGLTQQEDNVALVYDLGGGTFDVTVIAIHNKEIRVIVTDGDNNLGGFQWDLELVNYLDQQWMKQTGLSDTPLSTDAGSIDLLTITEEVKKSLSIRQKTLAVMHHAGRRLSVEVERAMFEQITTKLLDKTMKITRTAIQAAQQRGVQQIDQIILVGGSTRMPQVRERLEREFHLPLRVLDPDLAVAKGAALYGQKLLLEEQIKQPIAQITGTHSTQATFERTPEVVQDLAIQQLAEETKLPFTSIKKTIETHVINVTSRSFGVIATDIRRNTKIISNIILKNDPLPITRSHKYRTAEEDQANVEIQIVETNLAQVRVDNLQQGELLGKTILHLPAGLPQYSIIEVTFTLQRDGRLQVVGRDVQSNTTIAAEIQTLHSISEDEFRQARRRNSFITIV